jgi:hypothetical protein
VCVHEYPPSHLRLHPEGLSIHGRSLACHVLLIETPANGPILLDTGLGTTDYADLQSRLGYEFVCGYARPERDPSLAAVNQVKAMGLRSGNVWNDGPSVLHHRSSRFV